MLLCVPGNGKFVHSLDLFLDLPSYTKRSGQLAACRFLISFLYHLHDFFYFLKLFVVALLVPFPVSLAVGGHYINEPESSTPELAATQTSIPKWTTLLHWVSTWDHHTIEI